MSGVQNGGWGVAWDSSEVGSFDASGFARLSLSVKGAAGGETFELGLKDTADVEEKVPSQEVEDVSTDRWSELSVPLEEFGAVDLSSLENLSFGFNQAHGSGEICIDEIAFKGTVPSTETGAGTGGVSKGEPSQVGTGGETEPPEPPRQLTLEAEEITDAGTAMARRSASGDATLLLGAGDSATATFETVATAIYTASARYSNDNDGPLEEVDVAVDGSRIGSFTARDTGDYGAGWDRFVEARSLGSVDLDPGEHRLSIIVSGGDGHGLEIDWVRLVPEAQS